MNVRKRWLPAVLLAAMLSLFQLAMAQTRNVSGKVFDQSGNPLPSVVVSVKGKQTATQTNDAGEFTLANVTPVDVLIFSHVGFATAQETVGSNSSFSIRLQSLTSNLEEVVVIGYGSARKKDLTGSVATVTSKDFQRGQISTPEQMIAGKVAGVSIVSNGGRPGSGSTIRIRGGSSLRASNDPLIVIDGVPLESGGISGSSDPLGFINPNDIESFTVLKDASAAAIYGTRAANGVILITTKKGSGGKMRINFTTNNSISQLNKKVDVLTADQFRTIVNENGTPDKIAMLGDANTDWQDEIYQTAISTDNNISISGGVKRLPYRVSLGYANQNGILRTDNLQRMSASVMLSPTFFQNHLKVDLNLKGTLQKNRFAPQGAIGTAVSFDPTQPVYSDKVGSRFGGFFEWLDPTSATGLMGNVSRNPVGMILQRRDLSDPQRLIGNLQFDYKFHFLPELRANMNIGYDLANGQGTVYVSDSAASDYVAGGAGGQNNRYKATRTNTVFDFYLNYVKELRNIRSRIDATAGYSYNNFLTKRYAYASYNARGEKYPNSDPAFPYNKPEHTLLSYFGRLNYTFMDRYLLTATLRRDGSSRFGPDNKWGWFPSVALAWKLNEESFLSSSQVVSDLKLRIGYGVTGQQDGINDYDFLSFYGLSSPNATYQFGNTYYQMYRPGAFNPNIKWEETSTANVAIDYGFLNNRITGSIDFYYKKTSDLLNLIPQPAGTNFDAFFIANVGNMENKGVEFSINSEIIRKREFNWNAGFNITYNRNRITNLTVVPKDPNYRGILAGGISGGVGGGFAQIQQVGYSRNTFNLYQQVYDADGRPLENVFVDVNEDGIINQDDLVKSKSAVPDVIMGFSTSVSYKKWSASTVLRSSIGNYMYNNIYSNTGNLGQLLGNYVLYNASANYLDTRFVGNSNNLLSDHYISNASFLRMDNFNIGYDAGKVFNKQASLRISAGVQNVFVITKYKGLDPEISSGIDNNLYPRPRIFTLGASLDF